MYMFTQPLHKMWLKINFWEKYNWFEFRIFPLDWLA